MHTVITGWKHMRSSGGKIIWGFAAAGILVCLAAFCILPADGSEAEGTGYEVSFDPGIVGVAVPETLVTGSSGALTEALPVLKCPGYSFGGWYADGVRIRNSTVFTADTVAHAHWTKVFSDVYTVYFRADTAGTETPVLPSEVATTGLGTAVLPDGPSCAGMAFSGWYTSPECLPSQKVVSGTTLFACDAALYAGWEGTAVGYTVSLSTGLSILDDPDAVTTDGSGRADLPSLRMGGKEFLGWYTPEGKKVSGTTVYTSDITLCARWADVPKDWLPALWAVFIGIFLVTALRAVDRFYGRSEHADFPESL